MVCLIIGILQKPSRERERERERSLPHLTPKEKFRSSVPEGDDYRCVRSQRRAILSCQTKITHLYTYSSQRNTTITSKPTCTSRRL